MATACPSTGAAFTGRWFATVDPKQIDCPREGGWDAYGPRQQDGTIAVSTCHTFETNAKATVTGRIDGRRLALAAAAY